MRWRLSRNTLSGVLFAAAVAVAAPAGVPAAATAAPPAASASAWPGAAAGGHPTMSGPVVQLGYQMAARPPYNWSGQQDLCLNWLWTHESNWSATAANPGSDARGIAQKITGWSADYQPGNAAQQIAWGLIYIKDRYGTPCAAWVFEISHVPNWY